MMQPTVPRAPQRLAIGTLLSALLLASGALAADAPLPLDEANTAIVRARELIQSAPAGSKTFEEHRKKAAELLVRAQSELLKAKTAK
jgi:hypothetical protein